MYGVTRIPSVWNRLFSIWFYVMLKAAPSVCQTQVHSCIRYKSILSHANSTSASNPLLELNLCFLHIITHALRVRVMHHD